MLAGARLSGKLGNDTRIGFMNMTTEKTGDFLSRNYTVASVQKKIFARSNIGLLFVNKEYLQQPDTSGLFNRVLGFDYNLASRSNFWTGKFFYHRSFRPGNPEKQHAEGATLAYTSKHLSFRLSQTSVGENYLAETGYVRRKGYNFYGPELAFLFVPNKKVVTHGPYAKFENYYDPGHTKLDHEWEMGYKAEFSNTSILSAGISDNYILLKEAFDPTHVSNVFLPGGSDYRFRYGFVNFNTDNRNLLKGSISVYKGEFYNGDMNYMEGSMNYRYPPFANVGLSFTWTDLMLPAPFQREQFWLVAPKIDLTFTDKIFFSTLVQYNEQIDNLNLNMRFQWRYQPVSDLFVVYTDNYIPGTWNHRNRALVLKLTYWLN